MGVLKQLFGREDPVPGWAEFFQAEDFRIFMAALRQDLAGRAIPHEVDAAAGGVRLTQPDGDSQTLGLLNLAQVCHQAPRGEWPELIARHLTLSLDIAGAGADFVESLETDFARAKSKLKLRLYPEDYANRGLPLVYQPVADGLIAVLVYDLPESIASVPEDHLRRWGREREEVLALALENVRASASVKQSRIDLPTGGALELLTGENDYFATTHLLFLEQYVQPAPESGVLVGAPNRHGLVFHRIEGMEVIQALQALLGIVPGMYAEGPGSISPNLYWWRNGSLTLLPSEIDGGQIHFHPPQEFMDMLNAMAEEDE